MIPPTTPTIPSVSLILFIEKIISGRGGGPGLRVETGPPGTRGLLSWEYRTTFDPR